MNVQQSSDSCAVHEIHQPWRCPEIQKVEKKCMPQLRQIPDVGFVWYVTPADEVTDLEQQPASSNAKWEVDSNVHGNVADSKAFGVHEQEDDVSISFTLSQLRNAGHEMFRGADVQQTDDTDCEQQPAPSNVQYKIPEDEVMHNEEVVVKEEVDGAVYGNVVDSEELVTREVDDKAEGMVSNVNVMYNEEAVAKWEVDNNVHGNVADSKALEQDVSISFILSHLPNAGHEMFRGADVQQADATECIYNSDTCEQMYRNSTSHKTHTVDKSHERDVRPQTYVIGCVEFVQGSDKLYTCDVCNTACSDAGALSIHKKLHTNVKSFSCDVCHKEFSRSGNLKTHKRIHTSEKPYTCDICEKAFNHSSHLTRHKHIHSAVKPYACDICQKAYTQRCTLTIHKRIHTGDNLYICDICKKMFTRPSDLTTHKRTHSGVKPYTCDICQKAFTQLGHLTEHRRIHDVKSFTCDICNKAFNQGTSLTRHKRIHSGVKPYTCDICQKAFTQLGHLTRHKRIHDDVKPSTCDICKKVFTESSQQTTQMDSEWCKTLHTLVCNETFLLP